MTICETCIHQAEEIRVVGRDHCNVSDEEGCPDCGRAWHDGEIERINSEADDPAPRCTCPWYHDDSECPVHYPHAR